MTLGVVVFVLGVIISIALHEAGHFLVARRFKMVVSEFYVGIGPRLLGWNRGGTRFGLRALPLGGYVKIEGASPEAELPVGMDAARAFWRASAWKQLAVMASGSVVHLLVAFVLLLVVLAGTGVPQPTSTIAEVRPCLRASCVVQSPASVAGITAGETVVAVDGSPVRSWGEDVIGQLGDAPLTLTLERDGARRDVTVTPAQVDGRYVLGVVAQTRQERAGLSSVPQAALETTRLTLLSAQGLLELPGQLVGTAKDLLTGQERDPAGPVGLLGAAIISGDVSSAVSSDAAVWATLLALLAAVNVFLAVFNLLPIPPLDGGALAVIVFERVRHRFRRLRGYDGELERFDSSHLAAAMLLSLVLFTALSLVVLVADILDPVRLV